MLHEVYNNFFVITGSRDYRSANPNFSSTRGDWIVARYSCVKSSAGTHRYDYNIYYRNVPWTPVCGEFVNIQDSQKVNEANYSNLAAFKASSHFTKSASMVRLP